MKIAAILLVTLAYLTNPTPSAAGVIDQVAAITEMTTNRAEYGAKPVLWSTSLYPATLQYAQNCKFAYFNAQRRVKNNASPYFKIRHSCTYA